MLIRAGMIAALISQLSLDFVAMNRVSAQETSEGVHRDMSLSPVQRATARGQDDRSNRGTRATKGGNGSIANKSRRFEISDGYLFVDGQYLAPRNAIQSSETGFVIDGKAISLPLPIRSHRNGRRDPPREESGDGFGVSDEVDVDFRVNSNDLEPTDLMLYNRLAERCSENLNNGDVVVLFSDLRPLLISSASKDSFLQLITRAQTQEQKTQLLSQCVSLDYSPELLLDWAMNYVPSPELFRRATERLQLVDQRERENLAHIDAVRRLAAWNYPLSILGMLAVVLGMGHLLSTKPVPGDNSNGEIDEPMLNSAIGKSIALIAAMSGLDLVWTLLAHQAGAMTEVNPIGYRLIDTPELLILFKIALTAGALSILYSSRRHRTAQLASWWVCLILVLVTARWLTVSAVFA